MSPEVWQSAHEVWSWRENFLNLASLLLAAEIWSGARGVKRLMMGKDNIAHVPSAMPPNTNDFLLAKSGSLSCLWAQCLIYHQHDKTIERLEGLGGLGAHHGAVPTAQKQLSGFVCFPGRIYIT